jgi:methylated-DNA-[protein]-cysteine S-methyltransferase
MGQFSENVYKVVAQIPKGSICTYKEVAQLAGSPNAYRAVATLMAKNYNKDIPCHRVIRSDGTVGNYNRGGEEKKRALLEKEGVQLTHYVK